ncbi:hypothetical protein VIGAN_06204800 [Vigna angularis var. angularis]|uniref:Secreted protein n=1 Tax=Vigna angularis var. angularis TaxID=157739 RepID=A0A0S3SD42_PHAAN|nr:hypothetical protein VIGAN_06204800 [Vigna angularis var. angularis]
MLALSCSRLALSGILNLVVKLPLSTLTWSTLSSWSSTSTSSLVKPGSATSHTCALGVSLQSTRVFTDDPDPNPKPGKKLEMEGGRGKSRNGSH